MDLRKHIALSYPVAHAFAGVNAIGDKLANYGYLVVFDNDEYTGILTPRDLIERPHKLVIDCLVEKGRLISDEPILRVFDTFVKSKSPALPVFDGGKFIGIIERDKLINNMRNKIEQLYEQSLITNQTKDFLLNNISHEVRTPLNSLLGFMEIIADLKEGELNHKSYFDIIKDNAGQFLDTMNTIIDLSLLYAGQEIKTVINDVRVGSVLDDLSNYYSRTNTLQYRAFKVEFEEGIEDVVIRSDAGKIKYSIIHLTYILLEFVCSESIIISQKLISDNVLFFITSPGSVIDENEKEIINDLLDKEFVSEKLNKFDLGIELPLIQKLLKLLGGKASLLADNTQTAFVLKLPRYGLIEVKSDEPAMSVLN